MEINTNMLHVITDINDPLTEVVKDDPVRPEIPVKDRLGKNKEIFVEVGDDGKPTAAVCVMYQWFVPDEVSGLTGAGFDPEIAIFYTIWSYKPGAGRRLIFSVRDHILENRKTVNRFVTLSPPTEMARKFHLQNGAKELRVNKETVNYEYIS